MPWTREEDLQLLLQVLDLNVTVDQDIFQAASMRMGIPFNTLPVSHYLVLLSLISLPRWTLVLALDLSTYLFPPHTAALCFFLSISPTLFVPQLLGYLSSLSIVSTAASIMPGAWDAAAEKRLLLSVAYDCQRPSWEVIATRMGADYTAEAVR